MIDILKTVFRKYYYSILGLLAGALLLLLTIFLPIDSFLEKSIPHLTTRLLLYLSTEAVWCVFWIINRNYFPKNSKNKLGVFISVNTENDKQSQRIKVDLANGIRDLLRQNGLESTVNVIVLENFRAQRMSQVVLDYSRLGRVHEKDKPRNLTDRRRAARFNRLIKGSNAHFIIWGYIRERQDVENTYILTLDALVVHRPVDLKTSKTIVEEFLRIFPKEIALAEKLEFRGFKFASNLLYIASMYISGIAAYVSADPFTAYKLHHGLVKEFNKFSPLPPNLQQVRVNVIELMALELNQQARFHYYIKKDLDRTKALLKSAEKLSPDNYQILIFQSLLVFEQNRNIKESLVYLEHAQRVAGNDYTWLYNKAFLLMYSELFSDGLALYEQLRTVTFQGESEIVRQCLEFNKKILITEPKKIQSYCILGILYAFKLNDKKNGKKHFEYFLQEASTNPKFSFLTVKVRELLNEIDSPK